jgi:hypothetical protein
MHVNCDVQCLLVPALGPLHQRNARDSQDTQALSGLKERIEDWVSIPHYVFVTLLTFARLRLGLEILFYPISYHADLQRLGFIPARPYLPTWSTFNPFSTLSPLFPFSLYYDPTSSLLDCAKAVMTSPVVFVCASHFFEFWLYGTINEAVESSVVRPDNPDIISPDASNRHRVTTILGLRQQSSPIVRKAIRGLMAALGWAMPDGLDAPAGDQPSQPGHQLDSTEAQTIDVGGTTVTDVTPLVLGVAQTQDSDIEEVPELSRLAMSVVAVDELDRPPTPLSPLVSEMFDDEDDPRIRITSREGIVEMEVRLPRILSTHTEVVDDAHASPQIQYTQVLPQSDRSRHRVSQLSLEASDKISAIVKTQLVGLAVLPLRFVALRLVASHYIASHGESGHSRVVVPWPGLKELSWRSIGVQISRVALCSLLHLAIDLSLWGIQHAISLNVGKNLFEWGSL